MAWQDQQQSPWGKGKGPPSPEDLLAALLTKIKETFGGERRGDGHGPAGLGGLVPLIGGVIILVMVGSASFFTIAPGERGVVLRFGAFAKLASPGLNFKIPLMDEVVKVDVEMVRKEEFGFRTATPGQRTVYATEGYDAESLMLTADKNVIDVEWIVQYKVQDPVNFIFKVGDVPTAVRDVAEATMRRIIGNMDFDYVLSNREILAGSAAREMQKVLDGYQSGVNIVTVQLQDVNPPEPVKPAFNEVNEADQDMKRLVNEAEEAYNKVIPKARGQAKEILEESHGYAAERVNEAKGDTARFLAVLKEYKQAPEVTRQRLYLETMQDVLPNLQQIHVIDEAQRGILPLLDLNSGKAGPREVKP